MHAENAVDVVNEKIPLKKLVPYAIQHILAMYAGTIAVPIVLAQALHLSSGDTTLLIAAAIFVSGIGSLIQSFGVKSFIGAKLPLILGTSFVALPPVFIITATFGGGAGSLAYVFGGTLIAGLILFIAAPLYGKISFLFKPIVIGCYLIMLGVSLLPVSLASIIGYPGDPNYGDPRGIFLAIVTILVIVLVNRFAKGFLREMSIFAGLLVASLLGAVIGMIDFAPLSEANWFSTIKPFHFGIRFDTASIVLMFLGTFMASLDSVGTFSTVGKLCNKPIHGKPFNAAMRGEGVAVAIGGVFNCTPLTSYINNAGVIVVSGIRSRYVTICCGVILIILSVIPKFSAIATVIPSAVLGGGTLVIFALITVAGVETVAKAVDMSKIGNMMIVGISVSVGLMFNGQTEALAKLPEILRLLLSQGVVVTFLLAILLNLLFNFDEFRKVKSTEEKVD